MLLLSKVPSVLTKFHRDQDEDKKLQQYPLYRQFRNKIACRRCSNYIRVINNFTAY